MKHALLYKFILVYALVLAAGLVLISTFGSSMIQNTIVENRADEFYRQADSIETLCTSAMSSKSSALDDLYDSLSQIAAGENADIRVIDTSGTELINTAAELDTENPNVIEGFDHASFGPGYYEVSTFFGQYTENELNVMVPITGSMRTSGYIAISTPMTLLVRERDDILKNVFLLFFVLYLVSLSSFVLFIFAVYRPLGKITNGVKQFASGNLTHRIEVNSNDEMGYLTDSMNYMAADLKKNADYQKKFISNVSHDFRSPLTSIKGFTEAMCDGTIPPEMHEHYLQVISGETERLEKLTQGILALNGMDQNRVILNMTEFDINAELKKTAEVFEGSCRKKKISIDLVLTGEELPVRADREKIEQVIYNLLDNAVKFSPRNSTIRLETSEKYDKCYVSVKDEGCGIPTSELTSIWDRFYKGDSSRGKDRRGTGLGLSIVREIIQAHGQKINVLSTVGVGTEFFFTLDLAQE